MANRFFKAGRNQYQSQFVPQKMPLDMMARGLNNKQTQYNSTQKSILDSRAAFNERAYGTTHKAKLGEIEGQFDEFVEGSWDKDLTSPEFIREYQQFSADFRNNKDLATIRARQGNVDSLAKEERVLRESGQLDSARYHQVQMQLSKANSDQDVFEDTLPGLVIGERQDIRKTQEQYFNDLKAFGSEEIASMAGVFFEKGWSGISGTRIGQAAQRNFQEYRATPAGEQEAMQYEYDVARGLVDPDSTSQEQYIFDRFLSTGMDFQSGKSTVTGKAAALNKVVENQANAFISQDNPHVVAGTKATVGNPGKWDDNQGTTGQSGGNRDTAVTSIESLEGNLAQLTAAEQFNVTEDNRNIVLAAPFGTLVAEGTELTPEQSAQYRAHFTDQIGVTQTSINKTNGWIESDDLRMAEAVVATQGMEDSHLRSNASLGGQNHVQALQAYMGKEASISDATKMQVSDVMSEIAQLRTTEAGRGVLEGMGISILGKQGEELRAASGIGELELGVKSLASMMLNEAKDQLDDGDITLNDYVAIQKEVSDFKVAGYAYEASLDIAEAREEAKGNRESPLRNAYNGINPQTAAAPAIARSNSSTYDVFDSQHNKVGKAQDPSHLIENDVKYNPRNYGFQTSAGRVADMSQYDLDKGRVVSVDTVNPDASKSNTSFTLSVPTNMAKMDPVSVAELTNDGTLDAEDNFNPDGTINEGSLDQDQLEKVQYKMDSQRELLTVNVTDPITDASLLDARMQKEMNIIRQNPNSQSGNDAVVRLETLTDPVFATDLQLANELRPGYSYPITRTVLDIQAGQAVLPTEVVYDVTRLPGDGANAGFFSLEVKDANGNVVTTDPVVLPNMSEVSAYIKSIEIEQQEWIDDKLIIEGEVFNPQTEK